MILYHTTDAAEAIVRDGFRDAEGSYGFEGLTLRGVFLSVSPADEQDGARGVQVLEVALPDDLDLDEYAIKEEGRAVWEWCVPAAILNQHGRVRLLSEEAEG